MKAVRDCCPNETVTQSDHMCCESRILNSCYAAVSREFDLEISSTCIGRQRFWFFASRSLPATWRRRQSQLDKSRCSERVENAGRLDQVCLSVLPNLPIALSPRCRRRHRRLVSRLSSFRSESFTNYHTHTQPKASPPPPPHSLLCC